MNAAVKLSKWGNNIGLRVPKKVAQSLDLNENSEVYVAVEGNEMIITKATRKPRTLQELFAQHGVSEMEAGPKLVFEDVPLRGQEMI